MLDATILPFQPRLDRLSRALRTFWTPKTIPKPRSSTHLPTCFREAWSSTTPTHASFYLCTDPEQPAMMLVWCNHVLVTSISAAQASTPIHSPAPSTPKPRRLTPLHLPSPAPSTPMRASHSLPSSLPTHAPHAPPVSLPSIFPPSPDPTRLPSHPRAFRRAPLHPCTSIFHPQPRRLPSRSPPSSLPSPWRTSRAPSDSAPRGLRRIPSLGHVALGAWQLRLSSGWLLDVSYTWNLSDPCFGGSTIPNMAFSCQKRGQTDSGCIYNIYQLVVFNLQLVSNNIATWLLTTVPGSLEQYRPPPRFVPTVQFPTLRLWHITLLPRRPCLDCLAHVYCAHFGHPTPSYQPRSTAPLTTQHTSAKHGPALPHLRTDPERPTMMLAMRPCAQRNIACRTRCAHFGHPSYLIKPRNTAPFTSQRPSAKLDQHYPHPCFVLLVHCPRAACTDACGATMCSTQPCLPRAFCTF